MQKQIPIPDSPDRLVLFGSQDRHLRMIRDAFAVELSARGDTLSLSGEAEPVAMAATVVEELIGRMQRGRTILSRDVSDLVDSVRRNGAAPGDSEISVLARGQRVRPKTKGQSAYVNAMRRHDLTFCTGPAGTGKTYLAVALAVESLKRRDVKKLVLTRPAVEAGERLGFLPGDMLAKVNPYLRPLLDALHDMMDFEQVKLYMENDMIEIIPLAFMRGRTLNDSFIILDEAQNATVSQMKMFLTRMGMRSKMVVTGDVTQTDLAEPVRSGLIDAVQKLSSVAGIAKVELGREDIVRHPLVQDIVDAYERHKGDRSSDVPDDRPKLPQDEES
ncbi:MAG: PhoH family protein [Planctomycetes bacterium]|nr:PhoH family protein [Planctomycetota bacterium]